jgi:hypothetical protein
MKRPFVWLYERPDEETIAIMERQPGGRPTHDTLPNCDVTTRGGPPVLVCGPRTQALANACWPDEFILEVDGTTTTVILPHTLQPCGATEWAAPELAAQACVALWCLPVAPDMRRLLMRYVWADRYDEAWCALFVRLNRA